MVGKLLLSVFFLCVTQCVARAMVGRAPPSYKEETRLLEDLFRKVQSLEIVGLNLKRENQLLTMAVSKLQEEKNKLEEILKAGCDSSPNLIKDQPHKTNRLVSWGYRDSDGQELGPHRWHELDGVVKNGVRQSPININTYLTEKNKDLCEISVNYKGVSIKEVKNNGHTWVVSVGHNDETSGLLSGGPLDDEYQLLQYHAHWGGVNGRGSEHTINGRAYDAELHLVHKAKNSDKLAVLGIFVQVGKKHEEFEKIAKCLEKVKNDDETCTTDEFIHLSSLLPDNTSFFTYPGSLTTPPLSETVTWIVFKKPIEMSQSQLNVMRNLRSGHGRPGGPLPLVDNYRPVQPSNWRIIRYCPSQVDSDSEDEP